MAFPVLWQHGDLPDSDLQAGAETASRKAEVVWDGNWFNIKPV
jgi:hypothetical protein